MAKSWLLATNGVYVVAHNITPACGWVSNDVVSHIVVAFFFSKKIIKNRHTSCVARLLGWELHLIIHFKNIDLFGWFHSKYLVQWFIDHIILLTASILIDRPLLQLLLLLLLISHMLIAVLLVYWRFDIGEIVNGLISTIAIKSHKHVLAIYETISFEIYLIPARLWLFIAAIEWASKRAIFYTLSEDNDSRAKENWTKWDIDGGRAKEKRHRKSHFTEESKTEQKKQNKNLFIFRTRSIRILFRFAVVQCSVLVYSILKDMLLRMY